jgi:hypothetical protein
MDKNPNENKITQENEEFHFYTMKLNSKYNFNISYKFKSRLS